MWGCCLRERGVRAYIFINRDEVEKERRKKTSQVLCFLKTSYNKSPPKTSSSLYLWCCSKYMKSPNFFPLALNISSCNGYNSQFWSLMHNTNFNNSKLYIYIIYIYNIYIYIYIYLCMYVCMYVCNVLNILKDAWGNIIDLNKVKRKHSSKTDITV